MKKTALFLPILLVLCACSGADGVSRTVFSMDTVMQFTLYGAQAEPAAREVEEIIGAYDKAFSPTAAQSELRKINEAGGGKNLSPLWQSTLSRAQALCCETGGAFDPVLGSLTALWKKGELPAQDALSRARATSGLEKLSLAADARSCTLSSGAALDLGAVVKGEVSDAIWEKLVARQVSSAILSLGGNVVAFGEHPDGHPWVVGLRDPDGAAEDFLATVEVRDRFVVSSGDYERYFEKDGVRYHHILDPRTGAPAQSDLRSVSVIGKNGMQADAYSTALFVMGSVKALDFWRKSGDFEVVLVLKNKKVIVSEGLSSAFSLTNGAYTYEVAHR